jgi:hypothetical protein
MNVMNKITISSSNLSCVVGKNPFISRFSTFLKLLKQNNVIKHNNNFLNYDSKKTKYCVNGIKNEKDIIESWCQKNNKWITKPNIKRKEIFQLKNQWILSGIPDGITNTNELIEIKFRNYEINQEIPIYDYIQIQSYLQLFDLQTCVYVQGFNGEIYSELIHRDDSYWILHILPKILEFAQIYEKLCDDPNEMNKFLYFTSME